MHRDGDVRQPLCRALAIYSSNWQFDGPLISVRGVSKQRSNFRRR
jgi:hypothetical protein